MNPLINEINSEINNDGYNDYINDMELLEKKIRKNLSRRQYIDSYQKLIRYIHLDLSWSIDIFNELILYKLGDEIYSEDLINLIK